MGAQGAVGAQGAGGSTGAQGAVGAQGAGGSTGAQGAGGSTGAQGAGGSTGAQGAGGSTGAQGAGGSTGAQGAQGAGGSTGAQGAGGLTTTNANTLDNLDSSQFLRSDANDVLGGVLSYHSNTARLQFRNTSYNSYLYIGGWDSGTNSATISRIRTSNDNLHIDAGSNGLIHLNYYSQKDVVTTTTYPRTNNTFDLGTSNYRWRNIYVNDLQLSNEAKKDTGGNDVDGTWGDWTIQEGESDLFLINNRNGKKYKFNLTEVKE